MRVTRMPIDRWNDLVYVPQYPTGSLVEIWHSGLDDFSGHMDLIDTIEYTKFITIQRFLQRKKARRIGPNRLSV